MHQGGAGTERSLWWMLLSNKKTLRKIICLSLISLFTKLSYSQTSFFQSKHTSPAPSRWTPHRSGQDAVLWGTKPTDAWFSVTYMQVLHHPEGALLATLRFHHLGKADETRAPHLGRKGGQPWICGWMVVWPGVRICPLGLSASNVTDPLMRYLKRRCKERDKQCVSRKEQRGARSRSCEPVKASGGRAHPRS